MENTTTEFELYSDGVYRHWYYNFGTLYISNIEKNMVHLSTTELDCVMRRLENDETVHIAMPPLYYNGVVHVVMIMPIVEFMKTHYHLTIINTHEMEQPVFGIKLLDAIMLTKKSISHEESKKVIGIESAILFAEFDSRCKFNYYENTTYPHMYRFRIHVPGYLTLDNQKDCIEFWFPSKRIEDHITTTDKRPIVHVLEEVLDTNNCVNPIEGIEMLASVPKSNVGVVYYSHHCGGCSAAVNSNNDHFAFTTLDDYRMEPLRIYLRGIIPGRQVIINCVSQLSKSVMKSIKEIHPELFPNFSEEPNSPEIITGYLQLNRAK